MRDEVRMWFGRWTDRQLAVASLIGCIVFGIVGVIGVWGWLHDRQSSAVAYRTVTLKVVDAKNLSAAIEVKNKSGQRIIGNLYAVEATVWNAGNQSLGVPADRVREPLMVSVGGDTDIIDVSIQQTSMMSAGGLSANWVKAPGSVEITWRTFDPGDAFKMVILYQADSVRIPEWRQRIVGTTLSGSTFGAYETVMVRPAQFLPWALALLPTLMITFAAAVVWYVDGARAASLGKILTVALVVYIIAWAIASTMLNPPSPI